MRKILLFMTLGCSILLGACSDVEVGYLVSEHAAYTQDSLHLYNIENRLEELINILNEFHGKTGPLLEEKAELSELRQEKQWDLWDFDDYEIASVQEQLASCTDAETCKKLQALLDELNAQREVMRKEIKNLDDQIWNLQQQVNQIAEELGFGSEKELTNQVDKLKNTIEYEIPWVTSPIEGVLGTEPLVYSIENVKNENAANVRVCLLWEGDVCTWSKIWKLLPGGMSFQFALRIKDNVLFWKMRSLLSWTNRPIYNLISAGGMAACGYFE